MTAAKFVAICLRRYDPFAVSSSRSSEKSRSSSAKFTTRSNGARSPVGLRHQPLEVARAGPAPRAGRARDRRVGHDEQHVEGAAVAHQEGARDARHALEARLDLARGDGLAPVVLVDVLDPVDDLQVAAGQSRGTGRRCRSRRRRPRAAPREGRPAPPPRAGSARRRVRPPAARPGRRSARARRAAARRPSSPRTRRAASWSGRPCPRSCRSRCTARRRWSGRSGRSPPRGNPRPRGPSAGGRRR
jgi:hypothetical protein